MLNYVPARSEVDLNALVGICVLKCHYYVDIKIKESQIIPQNEHIKHYIVHLLFKVRSLRSGGG